MNYILCQCYLKLTKLRKMRWNMYTNSWLSKSELNQVKDPRHYIHMVTIKMYS